MNIRWAIVWVGLLLIEVDFISSLQCLSCQSKTSLSECYDNGKVETCWQKDQVCYTEIRYEQPNQKTGLYNLKRISAGCKQKSACLNDQNQNKRNCYHGLLREPQRCYKCCQSPACQGTREERKGAICKEAVETFFKRFDVNENNLVEYWEAKLQSEGRRMKNVNFFTTILKQDKSFSKTGVTLEKFNDLMNSWLEEQKLVADRDGNEKISFAEFFKFIRQQKTLATTASLTKGEAQKMFKRASGGKRFLNLCDFMTIYTKDVSAKLTKIRCKTRLYRPRGGTRVCNDSDVTGSVCKFTCNPGYAMMGTDTVTCLKTGQWDKRRPFCKRIECKEPLMPVNGGKRICTDSNLSFSKCRTTCDVKRGYVMNGHPNTMCSAKGEWTQPAACCARPCPPYATLDLILIFDSSSSVGMANWQKLMAFCGKIVGSFHVNQESVRVGAFRYNKEIDTATEVILGEVNSFQELKSKVHSIPYNGSGTMTGKALKHAFDFSLNVPMNRPHVRDVLLLFTDGSSQDDVIEPAMMLKNRGVDVNVVGIKNVMGKLDEGQMRQMVSEPIDDHIMLISGGFESLTQEFVARISDLVCGNPCQHLLQPNPSRNEL